MKSRTKEEADALLGKQGFFKGIMEAAQFEYVGGVPFLQPRTFVNYDADTKYDAHVKLREKGLQISLPRPKLDREYATIPYADVKKILHYQVPIVSLEMGSSLKVFSAAYKAVRDLSVGNVLDFVNSTRPEYHQTVTLPENFLCFIVQDGSEEIALLFACNTSNLKLQGEEILKKTRHKTESLNAIHFYELLFQYKLLGPVATLSDKNIAALNLLKKMSLAVYLAGKTIGGPAFKGILYHIRNDFFKGLMIAYGVPDDKILDLTTQLIDVYRKIFVSVTEYPGFPKEMKQKL